MLAPVAVSVVELPIQMAAFEPALIVGNPFTVTTVITLPPERLYEMFAVPAATPVTTPVAEFTVAIPVLPLLHVPPLVALLNVVVLPTHTVAVPVVAVSGLFLKIDMLPEFQLFTTISGL